MIGVPSPVVGAGLAVLLLCLVAAALWLVWRRPFVGLGVLVAGMAFHNFLLMVLLALHTPPLLIRVVQGWKELVLAVLVEFDLGIVAPFLLAAGRIDGERPAQAACAALGADNDSLLGKRT